MFQGQHDPAAMMALVGNKVGDGRDETTLESSDARGALARQANPLFDTLRRVLEGCRKGRSVRLVVSGKRAGTLR